MGGSRFTASVGTDRLASLARRHGLCQDVQAQDEAGQEDEAEQASPAMVPHEDWHEDQVQQVPSSLASWQDRSLSELERVRTHGAGLSACELMVPTFCLVQ